MNIFKELRKKRSLTQEELAQELNLTQTAISKWEKEVAFPDVMTLKKIADFYGVSIDYLLGNETALVSTGAEITPSAARDIWFATLTPIQQSLVHAILQLDNVQQLRAQAYFTGLLGY